MTRDFNIVFCHIQSLEPRGLFCRTICYFTFT